MTRLLAGRISWFAVTRAADEGGACRDYVLSDGAGAPLLQARAYPWRRQFVVAQAAPPHETAFTLLRRRSFPLTGRVDIVGAAGELLGDVRRNGTYRDRADVRGSFRDARSFGSRARENLLIGVLDAIAGADGSTSFGSSPGAFVWLVDDVPVGTLARARAPFADAAASSPAPADHTLTALARLTQRVRQWSARDTTRAWQLALQQDAVRGDERVIVAAALFAIELSHW